MACCTVLSVPHAAFAFCVLTDEQSFSFDALLVVTCSKLHDHHKIFPNVDCTLTVTDKFVVTVCYSDACRCRLSFIHLFGVGVHVCMSATCECQCDNCRCQA